MAILRADCRRAARFDAQALSAALAATPEEGGPTVAMVHGYRYDPDSKRRDPHGLLYSLSAPSRRLDPLGRVAPWPAGLGLDAAGLGLAFGWSARERGAAGWLRWGGNAFAAAYDEAARAGAALAEALVVLAAARPAPVDLFAHSLGARVALAALSRAARDGRRDVIDRLGRWILLAPAEFRETAREALDACAAIGARPPEIYAIHAAHNARYDALFETFAPRSARNGPSLGRGGLPGAPMRWADIALDHPDFRGWAAARGHALRAVEGPCHWSFYLDPAAMALYRAILRRDPGLDAETLGRIAPTPLRGGRPAPAARPAAGLEQVA